MYHIQAFDLKFMIETKKRVCLIKKQILGWRQEPVVKNTGWLLKGPTFKS